MAQDNEACLGAHGPPLSRLAFVYPEGHGSICRQARSFDIPRCRIAHRRPRRNLRLHDPLEGSAFHGKVCWSVPCHNYSVSNIRFHQHVCARHDKELCRPMLDQRDRKFAVSRWGLPPGLFSGCACASLQVLRCHTRHKPMWSPDWTFLPAPGSVY
ncbi:hypothetical protein BD413DRAFT_544055 [Trametes elegans]|nr:hypothetical protein BD413DRAFT_544055 [Trametes elegans]